MKLNQSIGEFRLFWSKMFLTQKWQFSKGMTMFHRRLQVLRALEQSGLMRSFYSTISNLMTKKGCYLKRTHVQISGLRNSKSVAWYILLRKVSTGDIIGSLAHANNNMAKKCLEFVYLIQKRVEPIFGTFSFFPLDCNTFVAPWCVWESNMKWMHWINKMRELLRADIEVQT